MDQRTRKKILLVDRDNSRRNTRVRMLQATGYDLEVREDHVEAEDLDHEPTFDLIIIALHRSKLDDAAAYSEKLRKSHPRLPILLVTDVGVYVPRGTLSPRVESGFPEEFMRHIAKMLAGSTHIRELPSESEEYSS